MEKLSKEEYDKETNRLKNQAKSDCAPWRVYAEKLGELIEKYTSENQSSQINKRSLNQTLSRKIKFVPIVFIPLFLFRQFIDC